MVSVIGRPSTRSLGLRKHFQSLAGANENDEAPFDRDLGGVADLSRQVPRRRSFCGVHPAMSACRSVVPVILLRSRFAIAVRRSSSRKTSSLHVTTAASSRPPSENLLSHWP